MSKGLKYHTKLAIIFSLFIISLIVILNYFTYFRETQVLKKNLIQSMIINVEQIGKNIDNQISLLSNMSFSIASNRRIFENMTVKQHEDYESHSEEYIRKNEFIEPFLSSYFISWDMLDGMFVFTNQGDSYYRSKGIYLPQEYDYKNEEWYRAISKSDNRYLLFLGNSLCSKNGGNYPVLSYIRHIYNIDTAEQLGYAKVDISLDSIMDGILKITNSNGVTEFNIIDEENRIILTNDGLGKGLLNKEIIFAANSGGGTVVEKNGKPVVMVYKKLSLAPWTLVYYFESTEIEKQLSKVYLLQILIILFSIILAVTASFLIAVSMTKNIKRLKKAMELVERGNLDVRIDIKNKDEIGRLAASFNKMVASIKELYQKLYSEKIASQEARIRALQAQINPHFLYNTMETIDSMAIAGENEAVSQMVRAISFCFKYAMDGRHMTSLEAEISHVMQYFMIMKKRYRDKIDLVINLPEKFKKVQIPRLSLQPIVENAILHGILKKTQGGTITVDCRSIEGAIMEICIEDNGIGMDEDRLEEVNAVLEDVSNEDSTENIGLRNVNCRFKFLFGNEYRLRLSSQVGKGTAVLLILPYAASRD